MAVAVVAVTTILITNMASGTHVVLGVELEVAVKVAVAVAVLLGFYLPMVVS